MGCFAKLTLKIENCCIELEDPRRVFYVKRHCHSSGKSQNRQSDQHCNNIVGITSPSQPKQDLSIQTNSTNLIWSNHFKEFLTWWFHLNKWQISIYNSSDNLLGPYMHSKGLILLPTIFYWVHKNGLSDLGPNVKSRPCLHPTLITYFYPLYTI